MNIRIPKEVENKINVEVEKMLSFQTESEQIETLKTALKSSLATIHDNECKIKELNEVIQRKSKL